MKTWPVSVAMCALVFAFGSVASATDLYPHQYAGQRYVAGTLILDGGYFSSVNADDIFTSDLTQATNTDLRINKEMWFLFNSAGTEWIETGSKVGYFPDGVTYCSTPCDFWEIGRPDGSIAWAQLNDSMTGQHSFEIAFENSSTGYWDIFVDGLLARSISSFTTFAQGDHVDIGIENSDTDNSFTSGTYADAVQARYENSQTPTWSQWDSASSFDNNTTGFSSVFYVAGSNSGSPDPANSVVQLNHT